MLPALPFLRTRSTKTDQKGAATLPPQSNYDVRDQGSSDECADAETGENRVLRSTPLAPRVRQVVHVQNESGDKIEELVWSDEGHEVSLGPSPRPLTELLLTCCMLTYNSTCHSTSNSASNSLSVVPPGRTFSSASSKPRLPLPTHANALAAPPRSKMNSSLPPAVQRQLPAGHARRLRLALSPPSAVQLRRPVGSPCVRLHRQHRPDSFTANTVSGSLRAGITAQEQTRLSSLDRRGPRRQVHFALVRKSRLLPSSQLGMVQTPASWSRTFPTRL